MSLFSILPKRERLSRSNAWNHENTIRAGFILIKSYMRCMETYMNPLVILIEILGHQVWLKFLRKWEDPLLMHRCWSIWKVWWLERTYASFGPKETFCLLAMRNTWSWSRVQKERFRASFIWKLLKASFSIFGWFLDSTTFYWFWGRVVVHPECIPCLDPT